MKNENLAEQREVFPVNTEMKSGVPKLPHLEGNFVDLMTLQPEHMGTQKRRCSESCVSTGSQN